MSKLAILGGAPMLAELPAYTRWPVPGNDAAEALNAVLESGVWGTLGPANAAFAAQYAAYCGTRFALPVLNGTVSLELILKALGVGYGDEVIAPPYTFTATIHAIVSVGATPVFADIDPGSYTLCPISCEQMITPRTRAIIAVHLGGRPADWDALSEVAGRHGLPLIEDSAHGAGSEFRRRRTGSLGVAGSFSFQASKNLSSGEGGAITTNDEALYHRLWSLHHNGRAFGDGGYDHPVLGTDARLSEWQCAMLLAGMKRLDADNERRMRSAAILDRALGRLPFIEPMRPDDRITRNGIHMYVFKYKKEGLKGLPRSLFIKALAAENVCQPAEGYCDPIYDMGFLRSAAYQKATGSVFKDSSARLPGNELAAREQGCWLYHASLLGDDEDIYRIVEAAERVAGQADELMRAGRS
ncbi:MAG: DegT/DnrJ/EryC1/StrS family aminotransferase [Clostridiales bacterium]|nr:DegT/DnrJ/EryC1/StrS family aminotransferase [Clostridiales bacterium]